MTKDKAVLLLLPGNQGDILCCNGEEIEFLVEDRGTNVIAVLGEKERKRLPPRGIRLWEGSIDYIEERWSGWYSRKGNFRKLTPEELNTLAEDGTLWKDEE